MLGVITCTLINCFVLFLSTCIQIHLISFIIFHQCEKKRKLDFVKARVRVSVKTNPKFFSPLGDVTLILHLPVFSAGTEAVQGSSHLNFQRDNGAQRHLVGTHCVLHQLSQFDKCSLRHSEILSPVFVWEFQQAQLLG